METILEQQRRYHEEKERLMDVMAKEMLTKKSTVSGPGQGLPPRWAASSGYPLGAFRDPQTRPLPPPRGLPPRPRLGNFIPGPAPPGPLV